MENKVLAVVNGTEITEMDLEKSLAKFPPERRNYFFSAEGRAQLLEQVVAWELIYNYALETGLENKQEYIDEINQVKKAILTQFAIQDKLSDVKVTEEELKAYYEENKEEFVQPEEVKASHILVDTEEKAKNALELLANGMEFEEAAQLLSECPSKTQGGDLGFFGRGMMVKEFEDAAFELEAGVVSEPVQTQFGYHLIKVTERKEEGCKNFEEVKGLVEARLVQEKQNQAYMNLVEELKQKFEVTIK